MQATKFLNLCFYLNDQLIQTRINPQLTALKLIRENLGLTGTKESCAEGDCGACTIALGKWEDKLYNYVAYNSCILPAAKLHGTHVITIEGLAQTNQLHIIQQMMLENHAIQCGYCTPGIIMSLFCLLANNKNPTQEEIYAALEGNLCRCTGYIQISHAAQAIIKAYNQNPRKFTTLFWPPYVHDIKRKLKNIDSICYTTSQTPNLDITKTYHIPDTLTAMFNLIRKYKNNYKIINGGTDVIVAANAHNILSENLIDISQIAALNHIDITTQIITIGGAVTLHKLMQHKLIQNKIPILCETIQQMSSTQIRNIATIAGNIANASPIADAACVLLALRTNLILKTKISTRKIALEKFYLDYKKTILKPQEIISHIEIPIPQGKCSFIKTSKRAAVDIATVNSAINIKILNNKISRCSIALGGVAPYPALAKKCEKFLIGKKLTDDVIAKAADLATKSFTPIADIRGSNKYRNSLIYNHLLQHLQQFSTF
jgi:xanthine dehydrogenase small subunit